MNHYTPLFSCENGARRRKRRKPEGSLRVLQRWDLCRLYKAGRSRQRKGRAGGLTPYRKGEVWDHKGLAGMSKGKGRKKKFSVTAEEGAPPRSSRVCPPNRYVQEKKKTGARTVRKGSLLRFGPGGAGGDIGECSRKGASSPASRRAQKTVEERPAKKIGHQAAESKREGTRGSEEGERSTAKRCRRRETDSI